jgi:hypothetical protein
MRIPTPIPEHWVSEFSRLWRGTLVDTVWKIFVVGALVGLVYFAIQLGVSGLAAIFLFLLVSALIVDDIRETLADVWNRRFWSYER